MAAALALGVFTPAFAFAQTASTTGTALVGQIQSLNAQIAALQQQRDQAVASLTSTFRQGSSGEQVTILQALLAAGLLPLLGPPAFFSLAALLVILASFALWHLVEKPALRPSSHYRKVAA